MISKFFGRTITVTEVRTDYGKPLLLYPPYQMQSGTNTTSFHCPFQSFPPTSFDCKEIVSGDGEVEAPFLLDINTDFLSDLDSC
jgi:hypothetical protein